MKKITLAPVVTFAAFILVLLSAVILSGSLEGDRDSLIAKSKNSLFSFDTIKTNLKDYIWPTDASTRITSTFAEYRTTHFHGGIDISTNGVTGYKVFAVRDGYVYRVKIYANDYGKMLFIKHPDGFVSEYAHLKGFNDEITKVVKQEQYRRGTYTVDLMFEPNQVAVKKGDIVAYTGDTGVGPPHLHFELHDENLNPINPLLLTTYTMQDNIPPTILRLMIAPVGPDAKIDNTIAPRYFSRFPGTREHKRLPQIINIEGHIGFGIDAMDKANQTYTKSGIYRTEFYVDDSLMFSMRLDRVPNDDTKEIDLDYDLPSIAAGTGKFQKLYIDDGNTLPFYDHRPEGTGIINTDAFREGKHEFRIVCFDIANNRSDLTGTLSISHKPIIQIANVNDKEIDVVGNLLASISKFTVYGKRLSDSRWSQHSLPTGRFETTAEGIRLPVNSDKYDMLKIQSETETGVQSTPLFYFKKKPNGSHAEASLTVEPERYYTRLTLSTKGMFTATPDMRVKEGVNTQRISLEQTDINKYIGVYLPSDTHEGTREISASAEVNGHAVEASKSIELFTIPADKAGSFSLHFGELLVSFDSGAVFRPVYMRVSRDYDNGNPVYVLEPQDVLLNGGITVSLPNNPNSHHKHLGLYFRSNRGWVFQTDKLDSTQHYFSTKITRTLGDFCLFGDDQPPSIGRLRVTPKGSTVSGSFHYGDNLSGVDVEQIKIYLDGNMIIPELDGEHSRASFASETPLTPGKHTLQIIVRDRAKNESSTERTFKTR